MKRTPRKKNLKKILVVDPDADSAELLRYYLQSLKYPAPSEAADGDAALTKALAEVPDLILMEVRLPKLDGFELVAHLRSNPWTRDMWIVAATAMALPGDREKCLANGFDAYLPKPFTLSDLHHLLQTAF